MIKRGVPSWHESRFTRSTLTVDAPGAYSYYGHSNNSVSHTLWSTSMRSTPWVAALLLMPIPPLAACASLPRAQRSAVSAVRTARSRYEAAWNTADTLTLSRMWMAGFQLTQEQGIHWSSAELTRQVRELRLHDSTNPRTWHPERIRVLLPAKLAVEEGTFRVEYVGDDPETPAGWLRGVYTAQWYLSPAGWLLNAEIETPLECTGAATSRCTTR